MVLMFVIRVVRIRREVSMMLIRVLSLLAMACCCSISNAEEVVEIPLSEIWAYSMKGTRDISRLEPKYFTKKFASQTGSEIGKQIKQSLVRKIRKELSQRPKNGPNPGFAVEGSGVDALRQAYEVLSGSRPIQNEFLAGGDICLFFFSYQAGSNVLIKSVDRKERTFHIRFEHVPHMSLEMTEHFALIPAGILSPGEYQVSVEWYGAQGEQVDSDDRFVCRSYSFIVSEQPKE